LGAALVFGTSGAIAKLMEVRHVDCAVSINNLSLGRLLIISRFASGPRFEQSRKGHMTYVGH
jgi:hypothetical protein